MPSVVLINVKTNVPDWLGAAGKTHINQVPYDETIARALCTMSYSIPSYRGQGYAMMYESSSCSAQKSAEDYLDEFLIDRRKEIEANPSLRITDRLTQRGVWYRVRPIMVADGFEPRKNWGITGESFAANIREHCKQLWPNENITREYLGIFAKARGMFYYKGEKYPIEFDAIEELSYLSKYTDKILEDENQQIKRELEQVSELTDIKAKQDEVQQRLAAIIAKNPGMQHLQQKLSELLKDL